MATDLLFAGVPTADLESTLTWYDALLGRAADVIVNDDEVMWRICDGGWLYLVQDPSRAGHALVTMAVSDLDQVVGEVAGRGLARPMIETVGEAGRNAPFTDPDGNTIAFIQVAAADAGQSHSGTTE